MTEEIYVPFNNSMDEEKMLKKLTKAELIHLVWSTSGLDDMIPAFIENMKEQDKMKKSGTLIPCRECLAIRGKFLNAGVLKKKGDIDAAK